MNYSRMNFRQILLVSETSSVKGLLIWQTNAACVNLMTSSNGNMFHCTVLLCAEFTGHWWISHTKASDMELWCFLWSTPEPTAKQTMETLGDLRRHRAHYDVIVMSVDFADTCLTEVMYIQRDCHEASYNFNRQNDNIGYWCFTRTRGLRLSNNV